MFYGGNRIVMKSRTKVAILGGGIGGLCAAHELAENAGELEIHVYEAGDALGGKARSQFLTGTGTGERLDLPGEHGFRFFPAWYNHIPDTMRRIPRPDGGSVLDNLVGCTEMGIAVVEAPQVFRLKRHAPASIGEFVDMADLVAEFFAGANLSLVDLGRFAIKMLEFLMTCEERRRDQYEEMSFFSFIEGATFSRQFQSYLNSSRFMVAMDARHGSACTIGNKVIQIMLDFWRAKGENDRVLRGPTCTQWLEPWETYLRDRGVVFHLGQSVKGFVLDAIGRRIVAAELSDGAPPVIADHYIVALPIERMKSCISDQMALLDTSLLRLRRARNMTAWMVGAQYFLREDVPICDGHVAYPDSPWAISSISQASFWNRDKAGQELFQNRYGDGGVKGVLSVDICDWETPSPRLGKSARKCTSAEEVLAEVWEQLKEGVNGAAGQVLSDSNLVCWHLDENVTFGKDGAANATPLLVHPPGSWFNRPGPAIAGIVNMFFAADYVQTETDLATMEGACHAARLAVNSLLTREGRPPAAAVFPVREEAGVLIKRAKDRDRKAWLEERRAPPPLVLRPGPFRGDEGPTLEDARRYQDRLKAALRALGPE
ncbi:hydroxysqualene dehydroxylase [Sorangium sp. So ce513]|uniref:hydroxysqualene dehydroxylase n=1 Tax=Sorangium sp. So ce513 TaxID=3133315 RepID=UPI003F63C774